jgi:EpsI family protein
VGGLPVLAWLGLFGLAVMDLAQRQWVFSDNAYAPWLLGLALLLLSVRVYQLDRNQVSASPGRALLWWAVGAPLYAVGRSQQIELLTLLACILLLVAVVLGLGGRQALARLRFPIGFMLLALPYPGWLIDRLTSPLKVWISMGAEELLYAIGYPVARSGVVLGLGPYRLLVADACTGLHSLILLTALGLLYLNLTGPRQRWQHALLVAVLLPVSLLANGIRVVVLLLVTYYWGDAVGQAFWHDVAGLVLYMSAFGLLVLLDGLLLRCLHPVRAAASRPVALAGSQAMRQDSGPASGDGARWPSSLRLSLLLLLTALAAQALTPRQMMAERKPMPPLEQLVPQQVGEWTHDQSADTLLVAADLQASVQRLYSQTLSRTYVNARDDRIMLSIAYGGRQLGNELQAHRPEYCYLAQGFSLLESHQSVLPLAGQALDVRRLVAVQNGRVEPITYWMTVGQQTTLPGLGRKLVQLRYGLLGEIPDGVLVRVSSLDGDSARAYAVHDDFVAALQRAVPGDLGLQAP